MIILLSGYFSLIVLIVLLVAAAKTIEQKRNRFLYVIIVVSFFTNLFLNPFQIDLRKNNTYLTSSYGNLNGEFYSCRILFDVSYQFAFIDGRSGFKKYFGKYYKTDSLIILESTGPLPVWFDDTLKIDIKSNQLYYSQNKSDRPMDYYSFDKPTQMRLNNAKRTAFEIK